MAEKENDPPQRRAGWVVAAIVAVVAVCAVSFMISQRPQEAIAVAEGDAAQAVRVNPPDGADTGRIAPEPYVAPRTAMDANAAGRNASAIEPAH
jgi:hypothetical protein